MKICPKCQQTYTDENLNFCLNDGAVLTQSGTANNDALPETVFVNQPRPTNPNQPLGNQQPFANQQYGAWNNPNQPQQPQFSMQTPAKSSKTWIWVVGILGFLVLFCGGGSLLGYFALREAGDDIVISNNNSRTNVSPTPASKVTKYDMTLWKPDVGEFATTTYAANKFTVEVTKPNYYYVVITQPNATTKAEHETQYMITRVTVVNRLAKPVKYGFGLVVHSDTTPLMQDYAFVIDSEKKKYRILRHSAKIEKVLTPWTYSSAIKSGTAENVLEVRDNGALMNFFINGQFIVPVDDEDDNTDGIAGIYSSDSIPIDFSNLEIEKK
jgi:hypothetical protein